MCEFIVSTSSFGVSIRKNAYVVFLKLLKNSFAQSITYIKFSKIIIAILFIFKLKSIILNSLDSTYFFISIYQHLYIKNKCKNFIKSVIKK
jgi:hypothetical protein